MHQRIPSVPIPKFVRARCKHYYELRNQRDTSKFIILVWLGFEAPLRACGIHWRSFKSATRGGRRLMNELARHAASAPHRPIAFAPAQANRTTDPNGTIRLTCPTPL